MACQTNSNVVSKARTAQLTFINPENSYYTMQIDRHEADIPLLWFLGKVLVKTPHSPLHGNMSLTQPGIY